MHKSAFTAHVLSVIAEHKICVRVDEKYVKHISELYSDISMKNVVRDVITLNVKNATFNISIPWSDLNSLVGMHIKVNTNNSNYAFWDKRERIDEYGNTSIVSIKRKGITFHATAIKNITINDE
jgi:hypothetical protein